MRPSVVIPCFFKDVPFDSSVERISQIGYDACELWGWKGMDLASCKAELSSVTQIVSTVVVNLIDTLVVG